MNEPLAPLVNAVLDPLVTCGALSTVKTNVWELGGVTPLEASMVIGYVPPSVSDGSPTMAPVPLP